MSRKKTLSQKDCQVNASKKSVEKIKFENLMPADSEKGDRESYQIALLWHQEAEKFTSKATLERLLRRGNHYVAVNGLGNNVFHVASLSNNRHFLDAFFKNCRQEFNEVVNAQNHEGLTPWQLAVLHDNAKAAKSLCKLGANTNGLDNQGKTLLHQAAVSGNLNEVKKTLFCGANLSFKDAEGHTALWHALENDHLEVAEWLQAEGIESTDVYQAAFEGDVKMLDKLIAMGMDVNVKNSDGKSAIGAAMSQHHQDCVLHLKKAGAKFKSDFSLAVKTGELSLLKMDLYPKMALKVSVEGNRTILESQFFESATSKPIVSTKICALDKNKGEQQLLVGTNLPAQYQSHIFPVMVSSDGALLLRDVNLPFALECRADKLTLSGKNQFQQFFADSHSLQVEKNASLKTQYEAIAQTNEFKNLGGWKAEKLMVSAKDSFWNVGTFESRAQIQVSGEKEFFNKNNVVAQKNIELTGFSRVHFHQDGKLVSGKKIFVTGGRLENDAQMISRGDQRFVLEKEFDNNGQIVSQSTCKIKASGGKNRNQIKTDKSLMVDVEHDFVNMGKMTGMKKIKLHSGRYVGEAGSEVIYPTLTIVGKHAVKNAGSIVGEKTHVESEKLISNLHGGTLKGNTVDLVTPEQYNVGCILTSAQADSSVHQILGLLRAGASVAEILSAPKTITWPVKIASYGIEAMCNLYQLYDRYCDNKSIGAKEVGRIISDQILPAVGLGFDIHAQTALLSHLIYDLTTETQTGTGQYLKGVVFVEHLISIAKATTGVNSQVLEALEKIAQGLHAIHVAKRTFSVSKAGWSYLMQPERSEAAKLELLAEADIWTRELLGLAKTMIGIDDVRSLPIDVLQFALDGGLSQPQKMDVMTSAAHTLAAAGNRAHLLSNENLQQVQAFSHVLRQAPKVMAIVDKWWDGTLSRQEAGRNLKTFFIENSRFVHPYISPYLTESGKEGAVLDTVLHYLQKDYNETGRLSLMAQNVHNAGMMNAHDKLSLGMQRTFQNVHGQSISSGGDATVVAGHTVENAGRLSAQNGDFLLFERDGFLNKGDLSGKTVWANSSKRAINEGKIFGENATLEGRLGAHNYERMQASIAKLVSKDIAENLGDMEAQLAVYEGAHINQAGTLKAIDAIVENLLSENGALPSLNWNGDVDVKGNVFLKTLGSFDYSLDTLQSGGMTSLDLSEEAKASFLSKWIKTPGGLSLQFPEVKSSGEEDEEPSETLRVDNRLDVAGPLFVTAPGYHFERDMREKTPWMPQSDFSFIGKGFHNKNGVYDFKGLTHFDVEEFTNIGSDAQMFFNQAVSLRAKQAVNKGRMFGDDALYVDIDKFINHQTLEEYEQSFTSSYRKPNPQVVKLSKPLPTGEVNFDAIIGRIGELDQLGGRFESKLGGSHLTIEGGSARALQYLTGKQYPLTDYGKNFEVLPEFSPAVIGSTGVNDIDLKGLFKTVGVHVYSGQGGRFGNNDGMLRDRPAFAEYEPASFEEQKHRHFRGPKKDKWGGGTSTMVSPSVWECREGDQNFDSSVDMEASIFVTPKGSVNFNGDTASIREFTSYHVSSEQQISRNLLSYVNQEARHEAWIVHSPMMFVGKDVNFNQKEFVHLRALKGSVAGSVNNNAPLAILEGAENVYYTKAKGNTFGLQFPSSGLNGLLNGDNAKSVFNRFLQDDTFVSAMTSLAKAKDGADLSLSAVQLAAEAFQLASLTAAACNEIGNNVPGWLGLLTDRWGLTQVEKTGQRVFNPSVSLRIGSQHGDSLKKVPVGTELLIGDRYYFNGKQLELYDGVKITAEAIKILATKGLYSAPGKSTAFSKSSETGLNLGIDLKNQDILSVGGDHFSSKTEQVAWDNNVLDAKIVELVAGELSGKGLEVHGDVGKVTIPTFEFESFQDTDHRENKAFSFTVGMNGSVGGQIAGGQYDSKQTNQMAGFYVNKLDLTANDGKLVGAKIQAPELNLARLDGKDEPITIESHSLENFSHGKSFSLGGGGVQNPNVTFPMKMGGKYQSESTKSTTQSSVLTNSEVALPSDINRDPNQVTTDIQKHHKNLGGMLIFSNPDKFKRDLERITSKFGSRVPQHEPVLEAHHQAVEKETIDFPGKLPNILAENRNLEEEIESTQNEPNHEENMRALENALQAEHQEVTSEAVREEPNCFAQTKTVEKETTENSDDTKQLIKNLQEILDGSITHLNDPPSPDDPQYFVKTLLQSARSQPEAYEYEWLEAPEEKRSLMGGVLNSLIPSAEASTAVLVPVAELMTSAVGAAVAHTASVLKGDFARNGLSKEDEEYLNSDTRPLENNQKEASQPTLPSIADQYGVMLEAKRELMFAEDRLNQEMGLMKLGEGFGKEANLAAAQEKYDMAVQNLAQANELLEMVQDHALLTNNHTTFPITTPLPRLEGFPDLNQDSSHDVLCGLPTNKPIEEELPSYVFPIEQPGEENRYTFPLPGLTPIWLLYRGDKTKGSPTTQVTEAGLNSPVPLTLKEKHVINDWTKERDTYLKKWRETDISDFSEETQDLLTKTKADDRILKAMTPDDLAGILKEGRGIEILKENGEPHRHDKEWTQADNCIDKVFDPLNNEDRASIAIRLNALKGYIDTAEVDILQEKLTDISKLSDKYENLTRESIWKINQSKLKP